MFLVQEVKFHTWAFRIYIIVAIDGQPTVSRSDMNLYLDEHYRPGDQITVTVYRDGQQIDLPVTLGGE